MRKIIILPFLLIPILLAISGCADIPTSFIMPKWDVDLNLPLASKTYTLDSILGKQKYIIADKGSDIFIIKSDTFHQDKYLVDFLKLEQEYTSYNNESTPQNGRKDVFIDFRNDQVKVDSAVFDKGTVHIVVRNNSSVRVNFSAITPGIKKDGVKMQIAGTVEPYQTKTLDQDLNGYTYTIPPEQLLLPESFQRQFWVTTYTSSSSTPNPGEKVVFDVQISNFYFSYVKGKFPPTSIGRNKTAFAFNDSKDAESYRNKISLKTATLKLRSSYNTAYVNPFVLYVDSLTITGKRGNSTINLLNQNGGIYHQVTIHQTSAELVFNETNSNVLDFMQFLPDSIYLDASYRLDGNNATGVLTKADLVRFETDFSTNSTIALKPTYLADTSKLDISSAQRPKLKNCLNAVMNIELDNALPLNAWGKVTVLDKDKKDLFVITRIGGSDSLFLSSAQINTTTGAFLKSTKNNYTISLDSTQLAKLGDAYYAKVSLTIETAGSNLQTPPKVTFKVSDWVKLNAWGSIKYNFKDEK
ncbi:MAG: hypothetical protein Q8903_01430 [Bacteroidota bacterium]|nr:hypothetical protein [Bacteroidota bacterium]